MSIFAWPLPCSGQVKKNEKNKQVQKSNFKKAK